MIHKRALLSTILSLAPCAVFATTAFESGFYMGAKIGAQHAMVSWDQSSYVNSYGEANPITFDEINMVINNQDQEGQAFHTNLMGNVAMGWARVMEKYFVALEASINIAEEQELSWDTNESNTSHTRFEGQPLNALTALNTDTEVTLENPDVNLDLRPGYLLAKNFVLYGRIGVAFNELSMEQDVDLDASAIIDAGGINKRGGGTSSEEETVYGLRLGLGLEYKMTPRLGFNVDYIFTDYGDIDTEYSNHYVGGSSVGPQPVPIDLTTLIAVSSEAEVTKSTLTAGFNWYFGGKKRHEFMLMDK